MEDCNCNKPDSFSLKSSFQSLTSAGSSMIKSLVSDYDPYVKDEEKQKRLEICRSCDFHNLLLGKESCKICGCFLSAKTSLKEQKCADEKNPRW